MYQLRIYKIINSSLNDSSFYKNGESTNTETEYINKEILMQLL